MRTYLAKGFIFLAITAECLGCNGKKDLSGMSQEEKIALRVANEDELSSEEMQRQLEARRAILERVKATRKSEADIIQAMHDAQDVLSPKRYAQLDKAQALWTRQGRGKDVNALTAQGVPSGEAFAQANLARAEFIRQRTSQAMLMDNPGIFGGFYLGSERRTIEIYEMPGQQINLVLRAPEAGFTFTATGSFDNGHAILSNPKFDHLTLAITHSSPDTLNVEIASLPDLDALFHTASLIEGNFKRANSHEADDVFAP